MKPGDGGLSCAQLQNEYIDAERYLAEADKEKSVMVGNVLRAVLFWPAILGTASNANEAISAADSRKVHLANQMSQKNCAIPGMQAVDGKSTESRQAVVTNLQSKEVQLSELKRLFDANLITKEVYAERQKTILDGPSQ